MREFRTHLFMHRPGAPQTIRFGDFELDLAAYALRRKEQTVRLERRPMDLLILLVERRNQLVSREEIVDRLWGNKVFVDVEMGVNTAIRKVRQALRDSPTSPKFIETVSGKGYRFVAPIADERLAKSAEQQSRVMLAILPFENLSKDPAQDYFSDGMTEETIGYLGCVNPERMGVIARTTSMAYKGTTKTVREIGAELAVDYVLESSVRLEKNRVRITSQLIRVNDQTHVWAETYDRELTGVLSIQSEIGTAIARHVQLQLAPGRLSALEHRQTSNVEAYDLYLRGRYFWNQLSPVTTRKAMEFYRRATELDPQYALAWSGIADAYSSGPISGDVSPLEIWDRGHDAVAHAIASGSDLPECQTSLGFLKFWLDWDWKAAEAAFRKSIELDPSYPLAHRLLGIVLAHMGDRPEEATVAIRRARELDPLNAATIALSAQVAFAARDHTAAVKFAEQAIATDPEFWIGYMQLGQALEQSGDPERAIEALNSAGRLSGGNSKPVSLRGYIFAKIGRRKDACEVLGALQAVAREKFVPPYAMALIHAGLDDRDTALEWLQRAYDAHDVHLLFPVFDPKWDAFRREPKFKKILDLCGFEQKAFSTQHSPFSD